MSYEKLFIICDIYASKEMQNRNSMTEKRTTKYGRVASHVDDKLMWIATKNVPP